MAAAIRQDPWGKTARQVEEVLSHSRPNGVAELFEAVVADARRRVADDERSDVAAEVRELIKVSGLSRAEFASRLGTSASRLSTYATGKVPSATILLRMPRLVEVVRRTA